MKLYIDSSLTEACWVFENETPTRRVYKDWFVDVPTHNVGEYLAVEWALFDVLARGIPHVEAYTDSQLVVRQVSGEYKINLPHLKARAEHVRRLLQLTKSTLSWVPREENLAGKELEKRKI